MVTLCIKWQYSFANFSMAFEHGIEIWYAILLRNSYIVKEQSKVLCIVDNGIAWSLGSRNVFYQYVLADEVLYVA